MSERSSSDGSAPDIRESDGSPSDGSSTGQSTEESTSDRWGGRSLVVVLYAVIVTITGVVGAALGAFGPGDLTSVTLLGLVELPPTALGLAIYGAVTVAVALGVPLALVAYVSRRTDADRAGENS